MLPAEGIFDYLTEHKIQPIGFMPLGSPQRPERDMCPEDVADLQTPEMQEIAKAHGCHPALIALKMGTSERTDSDSVLCS